MTVERQCSNGSHLSEHLVSRGYGCWVWSIFSRTLYSQQHWKQKQCVPPCKGLVCSQSSVMIRSPFGAKVSKACCPLSKIWVPSLQGSSAGKQLTSFTSFSGEWAPRNQNKCWCYGHSGASGFCQHHEAAKG